ncbi:FtsB family cell division protein [Geoalkalibacter halelectricus]|nr:septum formation initiator family protein [Geoalkalibacter halelectricus]
MFVAVAVLVGLALFGERGVLNTLRMHQYKQSLQEKIAEIETDNARLRAEIEALRNNSRHLEGVARKELGMVREGELVYQFRTAPRPDPPSLAAEESAP